MKDASLFLFRCLRRFVAHLSDLLPTQTLIWLPVGTPHNDCPWISSVFFFSKASYSFINKVASSENQDWLPYLHCILIKLRRCCSGWLAGGGGAGAGVAEEWDAVGRRTASDIEKYRKSLFFLDHGFIVQHPNMFRPCRPDDGNSSDVSSSLF